MTFIEKLEPRDIIRQARAKGQSALGEYEAKCFLSCFGIPLNREALVNDANSAAAEAAKIGFPVVLKASGAYLYHKTEVGGVVSNPRTKEQVRKASERLLKISGCDALLVQEMVSGERELVCGLTRVDQFGPCVMFGFGGIFTELVKDAVFRIAPLTSGDAREMVKEIRFQNLTGSFRGQSGVGMDKLSQVLVALGAHELAKKKLHAFNRAQWCEHFPQYPHFVQDILFDEEFFFPCP